jgi:hypothetical protein
MTRIGAPAGVTISRGLIGGIESVRLESEYLHKRVSPLNSGMNCLNGEQTTRESRSSIPASRGWAL